MNAVKVRVGLFLGIFLFGALLSAVFAADTSENNTCVACHIEDWENMQGSIHSKYQITCDRCHGGDPTKDDMAEAMSPEAGFIGVPDKKQIAQRCGGCHADVEAMNFYGLPTDQLARYKTSAHGKLLFDHNDEHGAVCADCHGAHNVLNVTDLNSPVYPSNLPSTCNTCHGDKTIMAPYNHPTDIFEKYKSSVHGVALFQKGDLGVANCAKCHGSHGAVPPGVKDIGATCGKCHMNEKKYFLEGPHAQASSDGIFPECAACHDYHDIQRPTTNLYNTACVNCHAQEDDAFKRGQHIKEMIDSANLAFLETTELVKQAAKEGIFVEDETASLEEVKSSVLEMAPRQHSLSMDKISELYNKAASSIDGIKKGIQEKRNAIKWRKAALIFVWIFIVFMVVVLRIKYVELKGKKNE